MADSKPTPEQLLESFKASLDDVAVIAQVLSKHCDTIEDLVGMVGLARENAGQLKLLYSLVAGSKK